MKKALLVVAALAVAASTYAQGNITFVNRNIPIASGAGTGGGNGNGTYNVPIFAADGTTSAGTLAGGVTVGLFSGSTLLGSTLLRSDTAANARFFATAAQTFDVPGITPGNTASLTVRAWQGASFDAAKAGGGQYGEWNFTSKPLGGTPVGGGTPVPTPSMTGWGPESGAGLNLVVPEPSTLAFGALGIGALALARRRK